MSKNLAKRKSLQKVIQIEKRRKQQCKYDKQMTNNQKETKNCKITKEITTTTTKSF